MAGAGLNVLEWDPDGPMPYSHNEPPSTFSSYGHLSLEMLGHTFPRIVMASGHRRRLKVTKVDGSLLPSQPLSNVEKCLRECLNASGCFSTSNFNELVKKIETVKDSSDSSDDEQPSPSERNCRSAFESAECGLFAGKLEQLDLAHTDIINDGFANSHVKHFMVSLLDLASFLVPVRTLMSTNASKHEPLYLQCFYKTKRGRPHDIYPINGVPDFGSRRKDGKSFILVGEVSKYSKEHALKGKKNIRRDHTPNGDGQLGMTLLASFLESGKPTAGILVCPSDVLLAYITFNEDQDIAMRYSIVSGPSTEDLTEWLPVMRFVRGVMPRRE